MAMKSEYISYHPIILCHRDVYVKIKFRNESRLFTYKIEGLFLGNVVVNIEKV